MRVELVASKVATSVGPEDGHLVYAAGTLVAVLVRLTGDIAEATNAAWFLEAGFGDVTPVTIASRYACHSHSHSRTYHMKLPVPHVCSPQISGVKLKYQANSM